MLTPIHQAIIDDQPDLVRCFKSAYKDEVDQYGFTPLELAQFLGRRQCEDQLKPTAHSHTMFKVQFKEMKSVSTIGLIEFEKKFHLVFRPFLTFPSYRELETVIRNCPYLLRLESFMGPRSQLEVDYQNKLQCGDFADTSIKWINSELGYGLFADEDLSEKSFVGEYTGIVRQVSRNHPKLNGYCFHYPTRFWSSNYFVIDALHEGNLTRFINHHAHPNLQPLWLVNRGLLHLIFITKQFIAAGSELTFNYGSDYWLHRKK